jgi:phage terminase large subunit GpA-like protein
MVMDNRGRWKWEKIPGHERNEALDCRNYANAAFVILHPNMDELRQKLIAPAEKKPEVKPRRRRTRRSAGEEW